ncbi:MAG: Rrf2 family transcriptional regulator [Bacteroidetes bacterium]|nr:Rrf2 family transcriptional regulator [Bacteroidota bacterium]
MFSKTCKYAIRAVVYIASQKECQRRVGATEIGKGIGAPKPFTSKILQELTKRGIISSQKGPNGGFFVTEQQLLTPIKMIVLTIDGDAIYTRCALGTGPCSDSTPCPVHAQFKHIRAQAIKMLNQTSIGMLSVNFSEGISVLMR